MKILSDEDLIWTELTNHLDELGAQYGCSFVALPIAHRGLATPDDEVARICQREGAAALLTANYKDFAAKVVYYQALLSAGVSAIVLRQPNPRMNHPDIDYQLALVEPHLQRIVTRLQRVKSRAPCKRVAAIVPSRYSFFPFWSWLPPLLVGQRVYAKFSP